MPLEGSSTRRLCVLYESDCEILKCYKEDARSTYTSDHASHAPALCMDALQKDYELDQFGVVNNAVYANYFQHAIHDGLERLGIDCDAYARANLGLAITDMRLSYKAPLRSKDRFRVLSGVSRVTGARVVMDEVILKSVTNGDGEEKDMVIAKCQVTMVVLDGDYKATRLPAAIKDR
eukprot:gene26695-4268_t